MIIFTLIRRVDWSQYWSCIWAHGPGLHHISLHYWYYWKIEKFREFRRTKQFEYRFPNFEHWICTIIFHLYFHSQFGLVLCRIQFCKKKYVIGYHRITWFQNGDVFWHVFTNHCQITVIYVVYIGNIIFWFHEKKIIILIFLLTIFWFPKKF